MRRATFCLSEEALRKLEKLARKNFRSKSKELEHLIMKENL